jgi:hypothetical protein
VRDHAGVLEPRDFVRGVAVGLDVVAGSGARIELPHAADHVRFREVDRVLLNGDDRQQIGVTGEVDGERALIAARDAVAAANPRGLHMRGLGGERVAFPLAGAEAFGGRERIRRRLGAPVHPDRNGAA